MCLQFISPKVYHVFSIQAYNYNLKDLFMAIFRKIFNLIDVFLAKIKKN